MFQGWGTYCLAIYEAASLSDRHVTRAWLLVVIAGCGASTKTAREPWVPEEEDAGNLPRFESVDDVDERAGQMLGRAVTLRDGKFLAAFPGAPIGIAVDVLPVSVIASEQVTKPGDVIREGPWRFTAIGRYADHDHLRYLALVPAMRPAIERRDANQQLLEQPLWFTPAAAQPDKRSPWRIWQERDGNTTLLVIERDGEVAGVRAEAEVQRVRALAIDPAVPMLYVERGGTLDDGDEITDANRVAKYEIYAYRNGTIERRLTFPAERTAVVIDGNVVRVFVLPDATTCPPAVLLTEGCSVERTDHAWAAGLFAVIDNRRVTMRLVDLPR
jgi:hypothetical protein